MLLLTVQHKLTSPCNALRIVLCDNGSTAAFKESVGSIIVQRGVNLEITAFGP
jgi:hypothetical protein